MSNEELLSVRGGISASILNAISRILETIFTLGRTLGSIIRGKKC